MINFKWINFIDVTRVLVDDDDNNNNITLLIYGLPHKRKCSICRWPTNGPKHVVKINYVRTFYVFPFILMDI